MFNDPQGPAGVTDIELDPDDLRTIYVSFNRSSGGRVYRIRRSSGPFSLVGADITSDLPTGVTVTCIAIARPGPETIYVGTDQGVYRGRSSDAGITWTWTSYNNGLPSGLLVRKIEIHPFTGIMRIATAGRSAFEVSTFTSDITPPVVIPPSDVTISATELNGARPFASARLDTFLFVTPIFDAVDPSPRNLGPQIAGETVTHETLFPIGTTVVTFRGQDASGNVGIATANVTVVAGTLEIFGAVDRSQLVSPGIVSVDLRLRNVGSGNARNIRMNQIIPTALTGTGNVTFLESLYLSQRSSTLPLAIEDLAAGQATHEIQLLFRVPSTVTEFTINERLTVESVNGASLPFFIAQPITIP